MWARQCGIWSGRREAEDTDDVRLRGPACVDRDSREGRELEVRRGGGEELPHPRGHGLVQPDVGEVCGLPRGVVACKRTETGLESWGGHAEN